MSTERPQKKQLDTKVREQFGTILREIRTSRQMTQAEIAGVAGVSPASIISYEKGNIAPPLDVAVAIAKHLNTSLDEMCGSGEIRISSLADVMKIIAAIDEYSNCMILNDMHIPSDAWSDDEQIEAMQLDESLPVQTVGIGFTHYRLMRFTEGYAKMRTLLSMGHIDHDVFSLWIEKEMMNAKEEERKRAALDAMNRADSGAE